MTEEILEKEETTVGSAEDLFTLLEDLRDLAATYFEATGEKLESRLEGFNEENPEDFEFTGEVIQLMSAYRYYEGQKDALDNVLNYILLSISNNEPIN